MKTTKTTLFLLCALALVSCNKDPQPDAARQKSYLTVQLGITSPLTKTDNSGSQLNGTAAESSVSQAVIYLVQSGQVKAILPVNTLNRVSHTGYDDGYETAVLETTAATGTYDVYAYAGSDTDPFGYAVGDTWDGATQKTFSAQSRGGVVNASNTAATDGEFRMFSQNDASVTGNTVPTVTLTAANNTTSNPAVAGTIYLDRLTAKVTASEAPGLLINTNISAEFPSATATVDGILPVSAALTVHLQQQWSDAAKRNLVTPATARYGLVNDSFGTGESPYATIQTSGSTYTSVTAADLTGRIVAMENPLYLLENVAEATPVWGTTSGVVFKVTMDVTGGGTPSTFFGYNKNSVHFLSLAALQAAYPNAFDVFGNKLPDGVTDDDAANLADAQALLASDVGQFRAQTKINVFEDGVMYYTYFIKDNNYNNYGIYRNTWYQLSVSELSNFGDDIPGGWNPDDPTVNPDPGTPVEDDKLYIKVKLLVNRWVASVTTVHLGE